VNRGSEFMPESQTDSFENLRMENKTVIIWFFRICRPIKRTPGSSYLIAGPISKAEFASNTRKQLREQRSGAMVRTFTFVRASRTVC